MGMSIELKKGAPTDIFELNNTLENNGYIVPIKIVKVSESINILFKEIIPSLEIKAMLK